MQAAAIPYASMGYRLNDGAEQLLVLATDSEWRTALDFGVAYRDRRPAADASCARLACLPMSSAVTPTVGQAVPPLAAALSGPLSYSRLEDLPDSRAYGAALSCKAISSRQADHRDFGTRHLNGPKSTRSAPARP